MLNLELNEEQELLRTTVRNLLADACPLAEVRRLEDDPVGYPVALWEQLGRLDLVGLLLPDEHGGQGMGPVEGVVLYQELGRALAPTPHLASAVLAGGALVAAGRPEQQARWLASVASGSAIVVPAWLEAGGGFEPEGIATRAEPAARGDGWVLRGEKRHVPFASSAERLLVLARTGSDREDVGLFLVDPAAPGVTLRQQFSLASDTQYAVTLDAVTVDGADRLGTAGWEVWEGLMRQAVTLVAAQAVGGARQALDITVQYAKDRHQFDKPLGAFQALAHYLADAVTVVDGAEMLVYEAAWAQAGGRPEADKLACMAKLFACKTYRDVTAMAQQVFGGIGFTVDFDIQLYFRRAKVLQLSWWDDRALERRVAAEVLDEPVAASAGS